MLALVAAVLVTVVTSMPVFLIGALSVAIATTVELPTYGIGLAVAAYWLAAAVSSAGTPLVSRSVNEQQLGIIAVALAISSLMGSATFVPHWTWLLVWAAIGGVGNGFGHPSSNHLLATKMPLSARASAFGVKQAAVPSAGLLAGLSIPVIALTLGWAMAFLMMAVFGVVALGLMFTQRPSQTQRPSSDPGHGRDSQPAPRHEESSGGQPFVLMATMTLFAAGAANSVVAFCVVGALERGIDTSLAGVLLAAGTGLSAVVRIILGVTVDRGRVSSLTLIRIAFAVGVLGLALMAIPSKPTYVIGFLLAVGIGWAWPGLVHFLVSHLAPTATAGATGTVQTGSYIGSTVGPALTGVVLFAGQGTFAWLTLSLMSLIALLLSFVLGRRIKL